MKRSALFWLTNLIVAGFGLLSLLAPFLFPQTNNPETQQIHFPVMTSLILLLCILLAFFEVQVSELDTKLIAFIGILIAINSGLRFLENAIPGPAGFSAVFFLIILVGYKFGGRMGFLMGSLTLFVSALITGGVGPWLPGQMITAGWVGQSATLLQYPIVKLKWQGKTGETILLGCFGALWGLLYGLIMNLWFWPLMGAVPGQNWSAAAGMIENLQRYSAYYLATSLIWDVSRAIGNITIISIMAQPILKIFNRFHSRFTFEVLETQP